MGSRIEDRLTHARQRSMVGRDAELAFFQQVTGQTAPSISLLHVWGPGGIGKSTLLKRFAEVSQPLCPVFLDARDFEASPDSLLAALRAGICSSPSDELLACLGKRSSRLILLIDSYDELAPLETYLRETLLPQFPGDALVVLAGRHPLSAAWRGDPGWQSLIHSLPLRNLTSEESSQLLARRNVPSEYHDAVIQLTHGFPLAISLLADVYAQRGALPTRLLPTPDPLQDIMPALLERIVPPTPGTAYRSALEICALARVTDETLLAAALSEEEKSHVSVHDLFRWLQSMSFVDMGHHGVFPHDIARDTLAADLRWRNRERYVALHRRIRAFYTTRIPLAKGAEQQRLLYDCIFLHRDSAIVCAAFTWQDTSLIADRLHAADTDALAAMVTRHEGNAAGALAAHWLKVQPQSAVVFRDSQHADAPPVGFYLLLGLAEMSAGDRNADPQVQAAWRYLNRSAPLRPGESATHLRFWMAGDTHQAMSPIQSLILVHLLRHFLTQTRPAYTFFTCHDAAQWESALSYLGLPRLPEAEASDGMGNGVFGRDWRALPPVQWLAYLAEREEAADQPVSLPDSHGLRVLVLSEADFKQAVLDALRAFPSVETLAQNPLCSARLVVSRTGLTADATARAEALRERLHQAAQSLQASPRAARGYRAVHHTYLSPAGTQEQVSVLLGLPFSTYRHHLAAGIADIVRLLWLQETGAMDTAHP